ncbi:MAG: hypothetical protein KGL90_05720 [Burkholderiales bacterium]|nr:hypothetical protein [Burkholderiales bacterium]
MNTIRRIRSVHIARRSVLSALGLATALLAQSHAVAAASQEQLESIKVYDGVSIAQDSTSSWGPWTEFEAPAAGPTAQLNLPKFTPDFYRSIGVLTPSQAPAIVECAAGSLCGFGAFVTGTAEQPSAVHSFITQGSTTGESSTPAILGETVRLTTSALAGGTNLMPDSGVLTLDGINTYSRNTAGVASVALSLQQAGEALDPRETRAMFANAWMQSYLSGSGNSAQMMLGAIGVTTTAPDMNALRGSGATATYTGLGIDSQTGKPRVRMNVDFGKSSFSMTFNEGGAVSTSPTFTGSGTISGSNFTTTALSAGTTGFARGAFTGSNAAGAIGVADVTQSGTHTVTPFIAGRLTPQ